MALSKGGGEVLWDSCMEALPNFDAASHLPACTNYALSTPTNTHRVLLLHHARCVRRAEQHDAIHASVCRRLSLAALQLWRERVSGAFFLSPKL